MNHPVSNVVPVAPAAVTLRDCHNGFRDELRRLLAKLDAKAVPPRPCVYASHAEISALVEDQVAYLRAITDALQPVFERVAVDAADYAGAREESYALIWGGVEDFLSPIERAADATGEP